MALVNACMTACKVSLTCACVLTTVWCLCVTATVIMSHDFQGMPSKAVLLVLAVGALGQAVIWKLLQQCHP